MKGLGLQPIGYACSRWNFAYSGTGVPGSGELSPGLYYSGLPRCGAGDDEETVKKKLCEDTCNDRLTITKTKSDTYGPRVSRHCVWHAVDEKCKSVPDFLSDDDGPVSEMDNAVFSPPYYADAAEWEALEDSTVIPQGHPACTGIEGVDRTNPSVATAGFADEECKFDNTIALPSARGARFCNIPAPSAPPSPASPPAPALPPRDCAEVPSTSIVSFDLVGDDGPLTPNPSPNGGTTYDVPVAVKVDGVISLASVDVRITIPTSGGAQPATIGMTTFASERTVHPTTSLLAIKDNALCVAYQLTQSVECADVNSESVSGHVNNCDSQKSAYMTLTPQSALHEGTLFVTAHSLAAFPSASSPLARRGAWMAGAERVFASDDTQLRTGATVQVADGTAIYHAFSQYGAEQPASVVNPIDEDTAAVFQVEITTATTPTWTIGMTNVLGLDQTGTDAIADERCYSFTRPTSFFADKACEAPYVETCCDVLEVEATGGLMWLSGRWQKHTSAHFLGRAVYRRYTQAVGAEDPQEYDEISFTHGDCGIGFPTGLSGGANHFTISGENGRFPRGLGITAGPRVPTVQPYSDDYLGGANRNVDFGVLTSTFEGLKADSVTGNLLASYDTQADLPADTCGSQDLRNALQYMATAAPFLGGVDPTVPVAADQLKAGFVFDECDETVVCIGDAFRYCKYSVYPDTIPGTITSWGCVA